MTKDIEIPPSPSTAPPAHRVRNNPLSGAWYFLRGFAIVTRPGIRGYVVVPLLINVVLFATLIYFGAAWLGAFTDDLLPGWLAFLSWILVPMFVFTALIAGFFVFNLVANLVASPFNGLLAEVVERQLTGRPPPPGGGWRILVAELGTTLIAEVCKFAYIAIRIVPLLVLFFIPGVSVVASILWVLLGAWMLTLTYIDYPMANHGIGFPEQRRRLRDRRLLGFGFGAAVMAALAVPILNFLVIPCAVAGATAMWVEQLDRDA